MTDLVTELHRVLEEDPTLVVIRDAAAEIERLRELFDSASAAATEQADEVLRLQKWEAEVIEALEGLPDNTAPDAIRRLRRQVERVEHAIESQWHYDDWGIEAVSTHRLRVALDE